MIFLFARTAWKSHPCKSSFHQRTPGNVNPDENNKKVCLAEEDLDASNIESANIRMEHQQRRTHETHINMYRRDQLGERQDHGTGTKMDATEKH